MQCRLRFIIRVLNRIDLRKQRADEGPCFFRNTRERKYYVLSIVKNIDFWI